MTRTFILQRLLASTSWLPAHQTSVTATDPDFLLPGYDEEEEMEQVEEEVIGEVLVVEEEKPVREPQPPPPLIYEKVK